MRRVCLIVLVLAAGLLVQPATNAQQSPVLQAMQEEMKRAMDGLRLKNEPAPYYIAYAVEDVATAEIRAKLGTVVADDSDRVRTFRVDVRVGDYAFDSSRFLSFDRDPGELASFGAYGLRMPLDDDYTMMRRQMWLATDGAYKRAVQTLSRKKAAAQSKTADPDEAPDFSREPASERVLAVTAPALGAKGWLEDLRKISAVFASYPDVYGSDVSLLESRGSRYFLNSEGFKVVEPTGQVSISISASTQAGDGMPLRDVFSAVGKSLADLPAPTELVARATDMARQLTAARAVPIGDDFTGPVLLEGQAAPALLAQSLVPLFLSQRAPDADGMMASFARQSATPTFLTRIGSRVLPESFSASDTPSLQRFGQAPVPGAYGVDDEGVPAKDVKLVQDGKLLTLLTSRTPQKGLPTSNGHARWGGAQPGVFQVESARGLPAADMKAKYVQMLKEQGRPYGYIVREVAGVADLTALAMDEDPMAIIAMLTGSGGTRSGPLILRAVKVLPDGTEQPVRGLNFAAIQPMTYRLIAEASRERTIYSFRSTSSGGMGATTMSSMPPLVSVIAPSLIFEELEIQRSRDTPLKPPVVPPPARK